MVAGGLSAANTTGNEQRIIAAPERVAESPTLSGSGRFLLLPGGALLRSAPPATICHPYRDEIIRTLTKDWLPNMPDNTETFWEGHEAPLPEGWFLACDPPEGG